MFFNSITSGAQDDLVKVTNLAYWQIRELGMCESIGWFSFSNPGDGGNRVYSNETAAIMDAEARKLVEFAIERTTKLMLEKKDLVKLVAEYLLEKEVLLKKDLERILGPRPFDDEEDVSK